MVRIISFLSLILFSSFSFAEKIYYDSPYNHNVVMPDNSLVPQNNALNSCQFIADNSDIWNPSGSFISSGTFIDTNDRFLRCLYKIGSTPAAATFYQNSVDGAFEGFKVEIDNLSEPDPGTDTDGDGIPNTEDSDIDNDGIPNEQDDDVDGDGVPNYIDESPYGDDTPIPTYDDMDGDGIPDSTDNDIDGDGIPNYIDADPLSNANKDNDGDGIPNNQDDDIDGDGIQNSEDDDIDGDGILNGEDNDIDGDGALNNQDSDIDGDGFINEEDDDIDGDGVPNNIDNSPNGWNVNSPEDGPTYCVIGGFYMGKGDCSNYATDTNGDGEYTTDEVNDPDSLIPDQVPIDSQPDSPALLETGYWTPVYPDGFSGVLLEFKKEFEKSKFMEFIDSFRFTNDGSVPVFSFYLDVGIFDFGVKSIDPDHYLPGIFGYLKVIILLTATLVAFRIVF